MYDINARNDHHNLKLKAIMSLNKEEDPAIYHVVVNHEEQYSILPENKEIPKGWQTVENTGKRGFCLEYIGQVWTDMRPLSLRKQMAAAETNSNVEKPITIN